MPTARIWLDLDQYLTDPAATVTVAAEAISAAGLMIADRRRRNGGDMWQKKHVRESGAAPAVITRARSSKHAELNQPIGEHFSRFLGMQRLDKGTAPPVLGFGIGDLTANALRPHYDATIPSWERANRRLFHLDDEPLGEVEYTLLCCHLDGERTRFTIKHNVPVAADGTLPADFDPAVRQGLQWWAACPPVLEKGLPSLQRFAVLDYDVRHLFGYGKRRGEYWNEFYQFFKPFSAWSKNMIERQRNLEETEPGYHAALGVADNGDLVLIHRYATIPQLADQMRAAAKRFELNVADAVLLDSGGSCCIWTNWAQNEGSVVACHFNFRPDRGAMVFLSLHGSRHPQEPRSCRQT